MLAQEWLSKDNKAQRGSLGNGCTAYGGALDTGLAIVRLDSCADDQLLPLDTGCVKVRTGLASAMCAIDDPTCDPAGQRSMQCEYM